VAATLLGAAVPGGYLALGGGSYDTPDVANPCVTREWRNPSDTEEVAEQIALSTLDGAACDLGTSREELVLALSSDESRAAYGRKHHLAPDELERATRRGLERAIADAQQAGALTGVEAAILRQAAARVSLENVLDIVDLIG
jgi:hypothetical protein